MSNQVQVTPGDQYAKMMVALDRCVSVDDCLKAKTAAEAMEAYYRQVKDKEAERKIRQIKLRAWKRMAEIISRIDLKGAKRRTEMIERIRHEIDVSFLSETTIAQLIKLAGVPESRFEELIEKAEGSLQNMVNMASRKPPKVPAVATEIERGFISEIGLIGNPTDEQPRDVGLTLAISKCDDLKAVSVLLHRGMAEQLREAAHQKHMTQWAVIREALNLWFSVNGFEKI